MEVVRIDSIRELKEKILFDQEYQPEIGRNRNHFVYRGIPDKHFQLVTSLQRCCKDRKDDLEEMILNNFAKYAELESPGVRESVWTRMILGQHHGLPTRLLDWTRSPLMSLHFSVTEADMDRMDQRDCVLWRVDIEELNAMLPKAYRDILARCREKVFTIDSLSRVCSDLAQYDADMHASASMVMLEPPTIDMRIANQYSFFSIVPSWAQTVEDILAGCGGVTRFLISKNIRWEIRDMLDQANINERIVYPGLDGIATWLGRYYFVRNTHRLTIKTMDVTDLDADVIVNPADTSLAPVSGLNAAIFRKAGEEELLQACRAIAPCPVGQIAETPGFALKAGRIYHAVGAYWDDQDPEAGIRAMRALYTGILEKLLASGFHSIGFPLIGVAAGGYPLEIAWETALQTCWEFRERTGGKPMDITFCVLSEATRSLGDATLARIQGRTGEVSADSDNLPFDYGLYPGNVNFNYR